MNARRNRVTVRSAMILAAAIAAAALISTMPADAHGKKSHGRKHGSVVAVHPRGPAHFVVPRHIVRRDVHVYRPYHVGRFYDPAHHHSHVVYRFPVLTNIGLVYSPYVYCGDHLMAGASIPSGVFVDFRWSDPHSGVVVGGSINSGRYGHPY